MTSIQEIWNFIFGGQFDVSKLTAIIVAAYAVVKSITEWRAKRKLLKADLEQTQTQAELSLARQEVKTLETCVSKLSDIVLTAYLSSNTVPVEVKRQLGTIGSELNKVAEIPLADTTVKLIDVVTQVIPAENIIKHKEEITEAAKLAEEVIDGANNIAQSAIDKISL